MKAKRVLIVDDVNSNRKLVAVFMKDLGYKTGMASNGEETMIRLESEAYDLVMIDLNMPGMDGFKTMKEIRSRDWEYKNIPCVVLTAFGSEKNLERCTELGVREIFLKPIDFVKLKKTIHKIMSS